MTAYTHIDKAELKAAGNVTDGQAVVIMLAGIGRELADGLESIRAEIRRTNLGRKK